MSLEFTAISPQNLDWNELVAAIPLQAHECIMLLARGQGLKLISRMVEYWEDSVYDNHELEQLRTELKVVRKLIDPQQHDAEQISDLLQRMDFVVTKAHEVGGHVEAIAD